MMLVLVLFFSYINPAFSQTGSLIISINPGATDSRSQNPIWPTNATVNSGTTILWLNKDSTYHQIVSGTPDQGPSNEFYGDYFGPGESYNITLQNPGNYDYYDPVWNHIKGHIIVTSDTGFNVSENLLLTNNTTPSSPDKTTVNFTQPVVADQTDLASDEKTNESSSASGLFSNGGILGKAHQLLNKLLGGENNKNVKDSMSLEISPLGTFESFFSGHMFGDTDSQTNSTFESLYNLSNSLSLSEYYPKAYWGTNGTGNGQVISPVGITFDKDGNLYVADYVGNRVIKYLSTDNGSYVSSEVTLGSPGIDEGQFLGPRNLITDSSNDIFVVDSVNNRIQKFDNNGTFITQWGSAGIKDGQFSLPIAIDVDSNNNLYVIDDGTDRIQKFDNNGNFLSVWHTGIQSDGSNHKDISINYLDKIYISDPVNNRIYTFNPDGLQLSTWSSDSLYPVFLQSPTSIATGPNSDIYVIDNDYTRIQKFDNNGTFVNEYHTSDAESNLRLSDLDVNQLGNIVATTDPRGYGSGIFGVSFKIIQFSPQQDGSNSLLEKPENVNETGHSKLPAISNYTSTSKNISDFHTINITSENEQSIDRTSPELITATITINPGATNSASQNPISPRNLTVSEGTVINWLNKDSTYHQIVSGTPDQGPSNEFYGDYFGPGESYNITLQNPGNYDYYDPAWSHLYGSIVVTASNLKDLNG
ncbi:6-bladed beta-propeller [Candidatus Nitrosocosmicus agrestis]|uniref:6-bladed beta-propeller n=1 Tax=Candidatus Nitrosocosmicus agrestis TaxID=2563600 RepID=UPI001E38F0EF|nr:6-bladed beta-propeller [Candidatus Nitrosocosmicus sp. SS]